MTRRWWLTSLLGLLAIHDSPSLGQAPLREVRPAPISYYDPRFEPILKASASWESRQGPSRQVVDQVCLVPDISTFLEAVASWDQGHFFPVLFDDVESSFRFIRAFRPARIVRMPRSGAVMASAEVWDRAVEAVGSSWTSTEEAGPSRLRGDSVPRSLGATPPGVVFSSPLAKMLGGAVALAAGRFQPLIRLDSGKGFAELLSIDEVDSFRRALDEKLDERVPAYAGLGDDCDFLTLAGDYPYRYRDQKGEENAVDDRVGRSGSDERRWAFAGRLLGDSTESVYRAMCSLFLQPDSALMFNGYDEFKAPWSSYSMRTAALKLSSTIPTSQVSGDPEATLEGWHETFDPSNSSGLVLINSHGTPTEFHLRGGPAHAPDIPRGVPSAVLMIHSFSAAEPTNPATVAGRWLANGAFLFYGSMNEPYLDAFRTPGLVGEMIAQRLPLVVASRQTLGETRGQPWRLVFLGDPLYRVKPKPTAPRLDRWQPTAGWPQYVETPRAPDAADSDLLFWALKVALARLQIGGTKPIPTPSADLAETLLAIRRGKLSPTERPVLDSLLIEVLLEARKGTVLKARLLALAESERFPAVRRTLETLVASDFQRALVLKDPIRVQAAWIDVMKTDGSREFKQQATTRAGRLSEASGKLDDWRILLKATLAFRPRPSDTEIISAELKRVLDAFKKSR